MANIRAFRRCVPTLKDRFMCTVVAEQSRLSEWDTAAPYAQLPGPKPLPVLGNIHRIVLGTYDFSNLSKVQQQLHAEFGKIARFAGILNRNDLVFVFDPEDVAKVYHQEGHWPQRPSFKSLKYYRTVLRKDLFQGFDGVLNDQGKAWQQARTQVNPVMMQTRNVQRYTSRINDVAEDFVARIPGWIGGDSKLPSSFGNEMHKWALESIALIALDTRLGCLEPTLAPDSEPQRMIDSVHIVFGCLHVLEIGSGLWSIVSTPTWRKFVTTMDYIVEVSMKYIGQAMERMKQRTEDHEASVLEKFIERDPNTMRAVVMALDMLVAGVDTTSHTCQNTLLHLSNNQDVQDKLHAELRTVMPDPRAPVTVEVLSELKYLRACLRESLRLTPVFTETLRTTRSEIVLANYQIPKGVDILMANAAMSRMEEHFPNADKFIPERWLRETGVRPNPYASLPFGHGSRKCVGMRFASLEMETLLAKLVRRFRWEWHEPEVQYTSTILTKPVSPMRFTVTPCAQ